MTEPADTRDESQLLQTIEAMKRERNDGYLVLIAKLQNENDIARDRTRYLERALTRQSIKTDDVTRELNAAREKMTELLASSHTTTVSNEVFIGLEEDLHRESTKVDVAEGQLEKLKQAAAKINVALGAALWRGGNWDEVTEASTNLSVVLKDIE
jgi:hypothetical protein